MFEGRYGVIEEKDKVGGRIAVLGTFLGKERAVCYSQLFGEVCFELVDGGGDRTPRIGYRPLFTVIGESDEEGRGTVHCSSIVNRRREGTFREGVDERFVFFVLFIGIGFVTALWSLRIDVLVFFRIVKNGIGIIGNIVEVVFFD